MLDSLLKTKSRSNFLEETFWPTDSKSLRLRSASFEIYPKHGVWDSPYKRLPNVLAKKACLD